MPNFGMSNIPDHLVTITINLSERRRMGLVKDEDFRTNMVLDTDTLMLQLKSERVWKLKAGSRGRVGLLLFSHNDVFI